MFVVEGMLFMGIYLNIMLKFWLKDEEKDEDIYEYE